MPVELVKIVEDDTPDFEQWPCLQAVIDESYQLWLQNKGWSYPEFLQNLNPHQRRVVTLKNLNYEVTNGGFTQWWENGYHCNAGELLQMLEGFAKNGSLGAQILVLVKAALRLLQEFDWEEGDYEALWFKLDPHELVYYELEEDWLNLLEVVAKTLD